MPKLSHSNLTIINVLDAKDFEDCHIPGSINIELEQVNEFINKTQKNTPIVVYCNNYLCATSDYVAKKLKAAGFSDVAVYAGGMSEWFLRKLPVQGACKAAYLRKHIERPAEVENSEGIVTIEQLMDKMGVKAK